MAADPKKEDKGMWATGPACGRCGQSTIVFCCSTAPAVRRKRVLICDRCRADQERKSPPQPVVHLVRK
jgi:hypothetical protein